MPAVECPSGLKGELRGLTVAEEDLILQFGSSNKKRADDALRELLVRCWTKTTDVGPYTKLDLDGPLDPSVLLVGDSFFLLVKLRTLSYGNELAVRGQCPNGHGWESLIDLSGIEVYELTEEAREKVKTGKPFETTLPVTGRTVQFRLAYFGDDMAVARMLKDNTEDASTEMLRSRILSISGFNAETGMDEETGLDTWGFIRSLPVSDSGALREAMELADCGLETEYESVCDVCDTHSMVSIENALDFFGRRKARKRRGSRQLRS